MAVSAGGSGYWIVSNNGEVASCGGAPSLGGYIDASARPSPVVAIAASPDGKGIFVVTADGGVHAFGDAVFHGSVPAATKLNAAIIGITVDRATGGYWLVARDGGVFSFDAPFHGSAANVRLNQPIVGMAGTPHGGGYWLVASDGGIFTYGNAAFKGSMGGTPLNKAVVGMAADPATGGYWLVAADGGIFSFDAPFHGSAGNVRLNRPIVGMATTPNGGGYWLVASDGGIFTYGNAAFKGSAVAAPSGPRMALTSVNWPAVVYPFSCGGAGYKVLQVSYPQPAAGTQVAVVLATCIAGAGTPPVNLLVYNGASSATTPQLMSTLVGPYPKDDYQASSFSATGSTITMAAATFSSPSVPNCCPDVHVTLHWAWTNSGYQRVP